MSEAKGATEATRAANRQVLERLPFSDRREFEDAARGLVAALPDGGVIKGDDGQAAMTGPSPARKETPGAGQPRRDSYRRLIAHAATTESGSHQSTLDGGFDHQSDHLRDGLWWSKTDDFGKCTPPEQHLCTTADFHGYAPPDWKSCVLQGTVGSNPTLSAEECWSGAMALAKAGRFA